MSKTWSIICRIQMQILNVIHNLRNMKLLQVLSNTRCYSDNVNTKHAFLC
jgi:hypothetical protein